MKKQYYSKSLNKILKKYVNKDTYGKISVILKDIFQRRAYEYGFSDEHMETEIKNFVSKCKTIEFLPKEFFRSEPILGKYSYSKRKITINLGDFFAISEDIHETLTHEIYHAIAAREDDTTGLIYINKKDYCEYGNALNEAFTEYASKRTCENNNENRYDTLSYHSITPIVPLLAASCGISEKELVKAGIQNRSKLMSLIYSKFPTKEHPIVAHEIIKKIETNLDVTYNVLYSEDASKSELKPELLGAAFAGIEEGIFELAAYQMQLDETLIPTEKAYRLKIMEKGIHYLKQINEEDYGVKDIITDVTISKKNEIQSMIGTEEISLTDEFLENKFKQEYDDGRKWDNRFVLEFMDMFCLSQRLSFISKKIIEKIKLPFTKKSKTFLDSGNVEQGEQNGTSSGYAKKSSETFNERCKVESNELRPMEEVQAENAEKRGIDEYINDNNIVK